MCWIVELWVSCIAYCSCGANVCWVGGVSRLCVHMIVMRYMRVFGGIVAIICMSNDFWVIVFGVSDLYDLGAIKILWGFLWWPTKPNVLHVLLFDSLWFVCILHHSIVKILPCLVSRILCPFGGVRCIF